MPKQEKTSGAVHTPEDLDVALRAAVPEVREFVKGLKAENMKLQRQVAKLQAQGVTKDNRIALLKEKLEPYLAQQRALDSIPQDELDAFLDLLAERQLERRRES